MRSAAPAENVENREGPKKVPVRPQKKLRRMALHEQTEVVRQSRKRIEQLTNIPEKGPEQNIIAWKCDGGILVK